MRKNVKKVLLGAALTGTMLAAAGMTGSAEEKKFTKQQVHEKILTLQ